MRFGFSAIKIKGPLHRACLRRLKRSFPTLSGSPTCHKDQPRGDGQGHAQHQRALHPAFPSFEELQQEPAGAYKGVRVTQLLVSENKQQRCRGRCGQGLKPGVCNAADLGLSEGRGQGVALLLCTFTLFITSEQQSCPAQTHRRLRGRAATSHLGPRGVRVAQGPQLQLLLEGS